MEEEEVTRPHLHLCHSGINCWQALSRSNESY